MGGECGKCVRGECVGRCMCVGGECGKCVRGVCVGGECGK